MWKLHNQGGQNEIYVIGKKQRDIAVRKARVGDHPCWDNTNEYVDILQTETLIL